MSTKNTTSPDLSPAVSIGGNAVEDTAALYDGDTPTPGDEREVEGGAS